MKSKGDRQVALGGLFVELLSIGWPCCCNLTATKSHEKRCYLSWEWYIQDMEFNLQERRPRSKNSQQQPLTRAILTMVRFLRCVNVIGCPPQTLTSSQTLLHPAIRICFVVFSATINSSHASMIFSYLSIGGEADARGDMFRPSFIPWSVQYILKKVSTQQGSQTKAIPCPVRSVRNRFIRHSKSSQTKDEKQEMAAY